MADLVNIQLNTKWVTFGLRVTTLHMVLGSATAVGVLYLVGELGKAQRPAVEPAADAPTPIARRATP